MRNGIARKGLRVRVLLLCVLLLLALLSSYIYRCVIGAQMYQNRLRRM